MTDPTPATALSIAAAAREAPGRIAAIVGGDAYTFADLADRAARAPARTAIVADRTVDTVVAILAALDRGDALALLHPKWTDGQRDAATAAVPAGARGLVVFTSGTTGAPKPVELTPRMLFASATASASVLGWRDGDRWLCPLPVAHVGGLSVITRCVIARATAVIDDLDGFERHRATLGSIVPAQLPALCDRDAPPAVRAVLVGGAAAPERLLARARARGWPLLRTYGMTEACSQVATERAPGAGLRPLPGIDVRIASDGRIEVSGPTVAGGRLRTGDLGRWTADGGLVVLGRADDVIVTGGENVHPALVEDALRSHPAIADACAFGLPDERWGQIVGAAIVAPAGVDDADLAEHLGRSLPAFARPRRVALVDALPLTAAGKADRRAAARLSTRPFPRG